MAQLHPSATGIHRSAREKLRQTRCKQAKVRVFVKLFVLESARDPRGMNKNSLRKRATTEILRRDHALCQSNCRIPLSAFAIFRFVIPHTLPDGSCGILRGLRIHGPECPEKNSLAV